MSFELFGDSTPPSTPDAPPPAGAPLADRMRPRRLEEVVGQDHVTGPDRLLGRLLTGSVFPSLIFWGPPGSGKTTLARILASTLNARFVGLSAVSAGVKEVREVVKLARQDRARRTLLFLDEIHRFNKAQQDALLPHVESGLLLLLGATTENPSFEVNAALLSRCRVVVLQPLSEDALAGLLDRAVADPERGLGARSYRFEAGAREALVRGADGDARRLLNSLEVAAGLAGALADDDAPVSIGLETVREALQASALRYDRAGEEHYNLISALHKSVRASDPQGAVYWTERMLAGGEDPLYLARRLVRMAVEDVGLADPSALTQVVAAQQAVHFLGLPEGAAALAQAAVYLALAPKSNRVYQAETRAREVIERTGSLPVPLAFRNAPTRLMKDIGYGKGYRYDHSETGAVSGQSGLPEELEGERFYEPSPRGFEAELGRRLKRVDEVRRRAAASDSGRGGEGEAGDAPPKRGEQDPPVRDAGDSPEG